MGLPFVDKVASLKGIGLSLKFSNNSMDVIAFSYLSIDKHQVKLIDILLYYMNIHLMKKYRSINGITFVNLRRQIIQQQSVFS